MGPSDTQRLFSAGRLGIVAAAGLGGGTAEVSEGDNRLAGAERDGRIVAADGTELLRAPLRFDGRDDLGTNAMLDVIGADGGPLGEVRVKSFSVTPRSRKATLSLLRDGRELARFEPGADRGENLAITVDGIVAGTLVKEHKRGLIRKSTTYTLELNGAAAPPARELIVAAAIRYDALLTTAAGAGLADRR